MGLARCIDTDYGEGPVHGNPQNKPLCEFPYLDPLLFHSSTILPSSDLYGVMRMVELMAKTCCNGQKAKSYKKLAKNFRCETHKLHRMSHNKLVKRLKRCEVGKKGKSKRKRVMNN